MAVLKFARRDGNCVSVLGGSSTRPARGFASRRGTPPRDEAGS
ncbi:hypothetical protein [Haladaptatus pallidirubidus]